MISTTIAIILVGIVTVVGGILFLRLHAFLALVLGALLVGILTPRSAIERASAIDRKVSIHSVGEDGDQVTLATEAPAGTIYVVLRRTGEDDHLERIAEVRVDRVVEDVRPDGAPVSLAIAKVTDAETAVSLDPDDIVITPHDHAAAVKLSKQTIGERVANGFGSTCAKIGILIAMAAIVGKCLLDSGAADRIVRSALNLFGERGAPMAFLSSGFLLGIPVFFDTVFYLMIPLGKALRMRTGRNYLLYVMTIVAGGTMAHSLVPPTPGPLFVAEQLGIDLGTMILAGGCVGIFTSGFGLIYSIAANRRWELPLRDSPDMSLKDLENLSQKADSELPPLWLAALPIVLPVALIAGFTIMKRFSEAFPEAVLDVAATLGNKNIALVLSAAIALGTLMVQKRTSLKDLAGSVQASLASGGVIILITAGGGAFGGILKQTGVADLIRQLPQGSPWLILTLAFFITTAIRTAQGSATVAMITAVGILSGIATSEALGCHPVYLALAIGCGSKPIGWMNDSGFWVIGKMSGMTEGETLKYITPLGSLMGVVGLIVILIGVTAFPGI